MLMTPMTPKVMARPIAASSSTEPRDNPYQIFWTISHSARLRLMELISAWITGFRSSGAVSSVAVRMVSASRLPRAAIVSIAAFLSSTLASVLSSSTARAASIVFLISASFSAASAEFSRSRLAGSASFRRPCAAASRAERSVLISVNWLVAAPMTPRSALLILTFVIRSGSTSAGFAGDRIGIGRFVIGTALEENRAAIGIDVEKAVAQLLQDLADMLVLGSDQRFDSRFAFREVADAERVDQHVDIVLGLDFARDRHARKCQARKCQANRDEENLYGAIHRLSRP